MSRSMLALSPDQLTAFDLDAFVAHAQALNQHNRLTFTTPFPKASSRWLSHYAFTPHPIALTSQGEVDGGLSWLVGVTLDFSFTRSLCATSYGTRGGSCYNPPASCSSKELPKSINTPITPSFAAICTKVI